MKKILLLAGIVHAFHTLSAQNTPPFSGARTYGLANTTACTADEWSILNNPAGLSAGKDPVVGFTQTLQPGFKAFNATAATVAVPLSIGTLAAAVHRTGDDLYSEQILALGYASTFGIASLGGTAHIVQYRAEGFGQTHKATLSLGGIAKLTPAFTVGAHILNINQPEFSGTGEHLPTVMTLGIAYTFSPYVWATSEIQKDLDYSATWRTAFEYEAHKKVYVRTGFSINPGIAYLGVGLRPGKLGIDYAMAYAFETGMRHQASVRYTFKRAGS